MIAAQTHLLHSQTALTAKHNGIQVKCGPKMGKKFN